MSKKLKAGILILSILFLTYFLVDRFYLRRQPVIYPNFCIEIPRGYETHGIDVSRYQKEIDWKLVSEMRDRGQRISFAIIKATESNYMTDRYFKQNWNEVKEQHLLRGAYLYFHPNVNGKSQAQYFISKVKLEPGDLPPVIDVEESNGMSDKNIQKALRDCADVLETHYRKKPILYSNVDFYENRLGKKFNDYPFWAAHYEQVREPRIERDWILWQHNCKGRVNGIDAEVDFNVVNGSLLALKELCID